MSSSRPFLVSLLACPTLLLTGAMFQHAAPSALLDLPAAPAAGAPDLSAVPALDQALSRLAADRVSWLEMTLWQKVQSNDLSYQAEGRFLAAPGCRRRLSLEVTVGGTRSQVQVISDGRGLSHRSQVGQGEASVTRLDLPALSAAAEDMLRHHGLGGVHALLLAIRRNLKEPRREVVLWGGREVIRITGQWPVDAARVADLPPYAVPRCCRVFLDSHSLWPCRVEWWAAEAGGAGVLLSQIEFRDPILNHPLPPERCTRAFALASARTVTTRHAD